MRLGATGRWAGLIALAFLPGSLFGADPVKPADAIPKIVELSKVKADPPKASDPVLLDVGKSRFYLVEDYTGPVTWELTGDSILLKEIDKPALVGMVQQGEAEPSYPEVPAGAVVLWGRKAGTAELSAWGVVGGKPKKLLTKPFTVGGIIPPPIPPPPKPVDPVVPKPVDPVVPTTDPSPFAEAGNRCLISFDSANTTRPAAQNSILYGKAVRDLLNSVCVAGPANEKDGAGNPMKEWRIYPANTDVSLVRPVFKNAFAKKGGADWIMLGNGTTGYSGPLPANETEALALIKKYLGGN